MSEADEPNDRNNILTEDFDSERSESISVRVARFVADASNREVDALDPLYYSVDTEALDALMDSNSDVEIRFEYEGYKVVIHSDKTIEIHSTS